jgi:hypothetical protein
VLPDVVLVCLNSFAEDVIGKDDVVLAGVQEPEVHATTTRKQGYYAELLLGHFLVNLCRAI